MNNKFRIKEKIQIDYGFTKNDSKFDENCLDVKDEIKFSYLEEVKEKRIKIQNLEEYLRILF